MPAFGVPESTPPLDRLRPAGNATLVGARANVGTGKPSAVTWKLGPLVPTVKVALLALVNAGASFTVKVKVCVPAAPTPLLTLRLIV